MPVLLVQGEQTSARFKAIMTETARCMPQAAQATVPKAGHSSPSQNPSAFVSAVRTFLSR